MWLAITLTCGSAFARAVLNAAEFEDRVYGCWLGKSIGGTLGAPIEGKREVQNVTGYLHPKGEPLPNDDLDLQLVWLKAVQERGLQGVDAQVLGEYWLSYIPPNWNEYGICKSNMRAGLLPPLSGMVENKWKHSNGAWIRTEIWACLLPGSPEAAARCAYEDASVDHGSGEGTNAALFCAAVESAAFVEKNRDRLIEIGLSMIPKDCRVARSVRIALDARAKGLTWQEAREQVVKDSADLGWFQAPANVAFFIIGWIYGDGDFGKSICTAVNCGDDTDCTGATLGAILGILGGRSGIPKEWVEPIGERIVTVAVDRGSFQPPATVAELTSQVVRLAPGCLVEKRCRLELSGAPTDLSGVADLKLADPGSVRSLWTRSGYAVSRDFVHSRVTLDYGREPFVQAGTSFTLKVLLENRMPSQRHYDLTLHLPDGWKIGPGRQAHAVMNDGRCETQFAIVADRIDDGVVHGILEVDATGRMERGFLPVVLLHRP